MDPRLTLERSALPHHSAPSLSYNGQDDSASRSQAEYLLGNVQSNESLNIRGSSFYPSHLSPLYGSEYSPILHLVPNMPIHQSRSCDLEGMSLTLDQVHFPTHPDDANTYHAASTQCTYPAGWRSTNLPMGQAEIENHDHLSSPRGIYGVSGHSTPPESSSTMVADPLSSPSAESSTLSGVQDDYADATSLSHGQVEGITLSRMGIQGRRATMQKVSRQRQQKKTKKEKDMVRKRIQRFDDEQHFEKICKLLEIPLNPKKTLVHRILVGVKELVKQHKHDRDLRSELGTGEADITAERAQLSAEADTCSYLSIDARSSALDGSGPGATPHSWPWSNEELDEA